MDPVFAIFIALLLFVLLALLEVPLGLALGAAGLVGITLVSTLQQALNVAASTPFSATSKYSLVVIPMYVLLGCLIANSSIGELIYSAVNRFASKLPGGLAATAVIATSLFSGISGSSAADVASFGRISVNAMARRGYRKEYAAAVVAAAGAFAALIPPGIGLVLYGIIADESIATMIVAGVVPGILSAVALVIAVVIRGALGAGMVPKQSAAEAMRAVASTPLLAGGSGCVSMPSASTTGGAAVAATSVRKVDSGLALPSYRRRDELLGVLYGMAIFIIAVGGLYGGYFTATEGGAMGALAAMIVVVLARRLSPHSLPSVLRRSLAETVSTTTMIFLLLVGGAIFTFFIVYSGIARDLSQWVGGLAVPPWLIVALLLAILLPLGMIIDGLSLMLLTAPIAVPIVTTLGFDGVWFGILMLKMVEIGLITPPVGMNVFIISGLVNVKPGGVFRAVTPFIILDLLFTALLFAFPDIVFWLPRLSGLM